MRRFALLGLATLVGLCGCSKPSEIVVLHAASLRRVFADAAAEYQKANPGARVRLEPSGSQVAIRKVTEQGLRADVVAVADARLIGELMVPAHAAFGLEFASNEIVLAHLQHSRFTEEIAAGSWPEILLRPGVRLGRVNPDDAPLGYHTLFAWQLAEKSGAFGDSGRDLAARLTAAVAREHVGADESELLAMLESKAVDYAFLYRSTAEDHHLKFLALPAQMNLGQPAFAPRYAEASVALKAKGGAQVVKGHAITYGVTIPARAANPGEAARFLAFLLGERGQEIQRAAGFRPLPLAVASGAEALPAALRPLSQAGPAAPAQ